MEAAVIDETARRRLRWRARRGLLENDIIVSRFLDRHASALDADAVIALEALLDLPDNELLDLLLERTELVPEMNTIAVGELLTRLRAA
jgi:antitoxin CptB